MTANDMDPITALPDIFMTRLGGYLSQRVGIPAAHAYLQQLAGARAAREKMGEHGFYSLSLLGQILATSMGEGSTLPTVEQLLDQTWLHLFLIIQPSRKLNRSRLNDTLLRPEHLHTIALMRTLPAPKALKLAAIIIHFNMPPEQALLKLDSIPMALLHDIIG